MRRCEGEGSDQTYAKRVGKGEEVEGWVDGGDAQLGKRDEQLRLRREEFD